MLAVKTKKKPKITFFCCFGKHNLVTVMTDDLIDTISKCFSGAMYRQLQPDVGEYAPTKSWGTIVCICEDTTNDKPVRNTNKMR
jgi:hypothetical protein